jgi:hypothetical protein
VTSITKSGRYRAVQEQKFYTLLKLNWYKPGVEDMPIIPPTWEAEAGGSQVPGQVSQS